MFFLQPISVLWGKRELFISLIVEGFNVSSFFAIRVTFFIIWGKWALLCSILPIYRGIIWMFFLDLLSCLVQQNNNIIHIKFNKTKKWKNVINTRCTYKTKTPRFIIADCPRASKTSSHHFSALRSKQLVQTIQNCFKTTVQLP